MESDLGKLFVGGISWDTDEERLKDYFGAYGEVTEAVIMRDRATGRARGFGFVVFSDPSVAELVVLQKHSIDGRVVEAKKAVPRGDDHHHAGLVHRGVGVVGGGFASASLPAAVAAHAKKVFVGGLPSTITEGEFKKHFERFGTITDVVVMYDHNTQRPRGFGFITYDSEEAVNRVLQKTFHELHGKMVEVKRAVPKELSPAPSLRSPPGYNTAYAANNRLGSFLHGYNLLSAAGGGLVGTRIPADVRFRNGYPPFGNIGFGTAAMNLDPRSSPSHSFGYGRGSTGFYNGSPTRYVNPIVGYGLEGGSSPIVGSNHRNIWGNGTGLGYGGTGSNGSLNSANRILTGGGGGAGGGGGVDWGSAAASSILEAQRRGGLGYENVRDDIVGFGKKNGDLDFSSVAANGLYEGAYADLYGDPTWSAAASKDLDGSIRSSYRHGRTAASDVVTGMDPGGYMNGYDSDRGWCACPSLCFAISVRATFYSLARSFRTLVNNFIGFLGRMQIEIWLCFRVFSSREKKIDTAARNKLGWLAFGGPGREKWDKIRDMDRDRFQEITATINNSLS